MRQREQRDFGAIEIRAVEEGGARHIRGIGSSFNTEYEIGEMFRETFREGAFDKTLAESDVAVLWQHQDGMVLGSTRSGTAKVWVDERGLQYDVEVPDTTWGNDAFVSVSRGDVWGSSIGFIPVKERWTEERDEDVLPLREILEVRLLETSPVTWPANPATSVMAEARAALEKSGLSPATVQALIERGVKGELATTDKPGVAHLAAGAPSRRNLDIYLSVIRGTR